MAACVLMFVDTRDQRAGHGRGFNATLLRERHAGGVTRGDRADCQVRDALQRCTEGLVHQHEAGELCELFPDGLRQSVHMRLPARAQPRSGFETWLQHRRGVRSPDAPVLLDHS